MSRRYRQDRKNKNKNKNQITHEYVTHKKDNTYYTQ